MSFLSFKNYNQIDFYFIFLEIYVALFKMPKKGKNRSFGRKTAGAKKVERHRSHETDEQKSDRLANQREAYR